MCYYSKFLLVHIYDVLCTAPQTINKSNIFQFFSFPSELLLLLNGLPLLTPPSPN